MVSSPHAINATLYEKLHFNFIRDIAPVAGIMRIPNVMVVAQEFPVRSVPEFMSYAKANPGKLNFASSGAGASNHMSGELFKAMTGSDMTHVPHRSSGPALTDLRRTSAGDVRRDDLDNRAHQGEHTAASSRDIGRSIGIAAGNSRHERFCTRLRSEQLVRVGYAEKYARGNRQHAQQGGE